MKNEYVLNRNDKVYLYGNNDLARNSYRRLLHYGYCVKGIIDKKDPGQDAVEPFKYIGLNGLKRVNSMSSSVVVICLNNGMEHETVAKGLSQMGINRILYIPMSISNSIEVQHKYRKAYHDFSNGYYEGLTFPLYVSEDIHQFVVIDYKDNEISFWCPKIILRTGTKEQYVKAAAERKLDNGDEIVKYADCRLEDFYPYTKLFDALGGGDADVSEYLWFQRNDDIERKKLLEDRKKLFRVFEERYRYDMAFFIDSPAKAAWNRRGWMAVQDGLHRIFYLNYKGYQCYPIYSSIEDYRQCCIYYEKLYNTFTREEVEMLGMEGIQDRGGGIKRLYK